MGIRFLLQTPFDDFHEAQKKRAEVSLLREEAAYAKLQHAMDRQKRIETNWLYKITSIVGLSLQNLWFLWTLLLVGWGTHIMRNRFQQQVTFASNGLETTIPQSEAIRLSEMALQTQYAEAHGRVLGFQDDTTHRRMQDGIQLLRTLKGQWERQALPEVSEAFEMPEGEQPIPSFREVLINADAEDDNPLVFGFNPTTGEPCRGTFEDAYSCGFFGDSQSGKTSWAKGLLLQTAQIWPSSQSWILDPHERRKDSLLAGLPKIPNFIRIDPRNPEHGLTNVNGQLDRRLYDSDTESFPPLIFVVDEVNAISKKEYKKMVETLLDRIATEGAKVKVFSFSLTQDTRVKKGLDFRDSLSSMFAFKLRPKRANLILSKDEIELHKRINKPGLVMFSPAQDEPKLLRVPYCKSSDVQYLRVANGGFVPPGRSVTSVETSSETPAETGETPHSLSFSDDVRARLKSLGVSQNSLARTLCIQRGTLSRILNNPAGVSDPDKDRINAALETLKQQKQQVQHSVQQPDNTVVEFKQRNRRSVPRGVK